MRPDDDIRALPGLRSNSETVNDIFGRVDRDLDPKILFKPPGNRRDRLTSVAIHPDQELAICPGEQVHWDQQQGG